LVRRVQSGAATGVRTRWSSRFAESRQIGETVASVVDSDLGWMTVGKSGNGFSLIASKGQQIDCMYERFLVQSDIASGFCNSFRVKQHSLFAPFDLLCAERLKRRGEKPSPPISQLPENG
jgi:hypothetical protein